MWDKKMLFSRRRRKNATFPNMQMIMAPNMVTGCREVLSDEDHGAGNPAPTPLKL